MSIPKNDLLTVGVDLPESYNVWEKAGDTKESSWPASVPMTFKFDFTGVPLEHVFELAVGALVIDSRPALKKEGFEFCNANRVVSVNVAERKKRGAAQPRNLASQLVKSLAEGTTRQELGKLKKEQLANLMSELEEIQAEIMAQKEKES